MATNHEVGSSNLSERTIKQSLKTAPGQSSGAVFVCEGEDSVLENPQLKFNKNRPTSTKVQHSKVQHVGLFLTVKEAASKIGKTPMTITRWCEMGKLPATSKPYGKKITWQISPQALELIAMQEIEKAQKQEREEEAQKLNKPHADYQKGWSNAMAGGFFDGKPFSPNTSKNYKALVDKFLKKHASLSPKTLQAALMVIPAQQYAKKARLYEALVCFGKFLIDENALEAAFLETTKALKPKRHLPPKRNVVDETGINALLSVCETVQERLIVILLLNTGLRASEACSLRWGDIDMEDGWLVVRLGKGNKTRKVGISAHLLEILQEHKASVPNSEHHPVLLNRKGKAMDRSGLFQRVERLGELAGITVSPHALRRAFVTINANKGRPLVILQRSCGHSDIKTTMSYCMTAEQEVIEAMKGWD